MADVDQMPRIMGVVDQREGDVGDERHSMRGVVGMDKKEECVGDETESMRGVLMLKRMHGCQQYKLAQYLALACIAGEPLSLSVCVCVLFHSCVFSSHVIGTRRRAAARFQWRRFTTA